MSDIRGNSRASAWSAAILLAALLPWIGQGAAPRELTDGEFEKLHRQLQPPRDEAWRTVPWKLSVLEAQQQAAREKKPVFMLVRSGHPLGCVGNNGALDRASSLADAEVVKRLTTHFIPVAVDQHVHRQLKDAEGELFAKV